MPTVEAKKRASEKYSKSIKNIAIQLKKTDNTLIQLEDVAINNNTSLSKVVKACIEYITDNNIDISKYIDR